MRAPTSHGSGRVHAVFDWVHGQVRGRIWQGRYYALYARVDSAASPIFCWLPLLLEWECGYVIA
jgi:hypothetical protein